MFWKLTRKKPFFCWNHQFESKFQTPTNHQDQEGIRLPTQIISFFSLFLANVHFFTFRLKTIISNEMEQHVFRFTNKLSPKTSQDASRQYISLYPPVFLFPSISLSRSPSKFLLEFIIFKLLMRIMNASWKFLFIPDSKHFSHFSSSSSFYFT